MVDMTGSDPIWLKLALGLVPLLTALIGGAFALTNTVNRRIERFKGLADLQKDYPTSLNPHHALETITARELVGIYQATDPTLRKLRHRRLRGLAMCGIGYLALLLAWVHLLPTLLGGILGILLILIGIVGGLFVASSMRATKAAIEKNLVLTPEKPTDTNE